MAAANSLGGVGSGIDTTALITGLVNADSGRINALKSKQTSTNSAISTLSDISSSLGALQSAVDALSTASGVGSYKGTSSSPAIAISTSGTAQPGAYSMSVTQLAKAQRTYSNTFSSPSAAVHMPRTEWQAETPARSDATRSNVSEAHANHCPTKRRCTY